MLDNFERPNVVSYLQNKDLRILTIGQREDIDTDLTPFIEELRPLNPHLYLDMDVFSFIKDRKVVGKKFIKETYKTAHDKNIPIHACNLQPSSEVDYLLYKEIQRSYMKKDLIPSCSPISLVKDNHYIGEFSELYTVARITKNVEKRVKCAIVYGSSSFIIHLVRRLTRLGFKETLEHSQRNEKNFIRVKDLLWDIL